MHFHFPFTVLSVLWVATFTAHLMVLVVLMGRDRVRQFPWFTAYIAMVAFRLMTSRILTGRLAQMTLLTVFIVMACVGAFLGLMVVIEVARRAFGRVRRASWVMGALVLLAIGAAVLRFWGPWPDWKTLTSAPPLQFAQLLAQKGMLLADVENIALGLLIVLVGRRAGAGFKSKVQQVAIGLMTASMSQLAIQGIWEAIAKTAVAHTRAEYTQILGLRDRLFNTNNAVYIAVLLWWIVCLWIDEPKRLQEEAPLPEPTTGSVPEIPLPVVEHAAEESAAAEDGSVHARELPRGPEEEAN
jgi:hypothetical protein